MNSETLRRWIGTAALVVIAFALVTGLALFAFPTNQSGPIRLTSASNFGSLQVDDGSLSAAAFGFTSDPDTGIYRVGTNNGALEAGGSAALTWNASGVAIPGTFQPSGVSTFGAISKFPDGSASAPAIAFTNDTNNGLYRVSTDDIAITTGGVQAVDVNSTTVTIVPAVSASTSVSSPTLTATSNMTTPVITLDSVQLSGPYKYGCASNKVNGSTISHGLGSSPSVYFAQAVNTTSVVWVASVSSSVLTIGAPASETFATICWFAGK